MRRHVVPRALIALFAVLALEAPGMLVAQDAAHGASTRILGSRNLALGHWAYEYIARLRDRGFLTNLDPLVQPYRRIDVAEGLMHLDADTLSRPVADWIRTLRREFAPELERLGGRDGRHWGLIASGGAVASNTLRLDALRPIDSSGVWSNGNVGVWVRSGPFVAESRLAGDAYWKHDPDGLDPGKGRLASSRLFHTDNAYLAVDFSFGRIEFGRLARNWGAVGSQGLMISNNPFVYPQLGFEAYAGRFSVHSFTGQLDLQDSVRRFISAHQVDYTTSNFAASVGEAIVYGNPSGSPSLSYMNPVEFLFFDQESPPNQYEVTPNLMFNGQFWYRTDGLVLHGEGAIDDIDIHPTTLVNGVPNGLPARYAFNVGVRLTSAAPWMTPRIEYQQVSAFAYRTRTGKDAWTFLERGIGNNYDGYDQLSLLLDLYPPINDLRLTPAIEILRQGQSSIRDLIPQPDSVFALQPTLFVGVKETVYRLGLQGHYQPFQFHLGSIWLDWDAGEDFIKNDNHVAGVNANKFVVVGRAGMRLDLPR